MPIEKIEAGKVVCLFGSGDILIAPGHDEGTMDLQITLSQQAPHPIDVSMLELRGTKIENWAVKFYFDKPESVDAFIHVLQDFKKEKFAPQDIKETGDTAHNTQSPKAGGAAR